MVTIEVAPVADPPVARPDRSRPTPAAPWCPGAGERRPIPTATWTPRRCAWWSGLLGARPGWQGPGSGIGRRKAPAGATASPTRSATAAGVLHRRGGLHGGRGQSAAGCRRRLLRHRPRRPQSPSTCWPTTPTPTATSHHRLGRRVGSGRHRHLPRRRPVPVRAPGFPRRLARHRRGHLHLHGGRPRRGRGPGDRHRDHRPRRPAGRRRTARRPPGPTRSPCWRIPPEWPSLRPTAIPTRTATA